MKKSEAIHLSAALGRLLSIKLLIRMGGWGLQGWLLEGVVLKLTLRG